MSKLNDLLERIDPTRTIERFSSILDGVLNSFAYPVSPIDDYSEFRGILGKFCWQVESCMMGSCSEMLADDDMIEGAALMVLFEAYGSRDAKPAYIVAKSGVDGGIYGVLKKVGQAIAKKYTDRQIRAEVDSFLCELSEDGDEYADAMEEYILRFANILPTEALRNDALAVRMNFSQILEMHPYLVKRMREIGRI